MEEKEEVEEVEEDEEEEKRDSPHLERVRWISFSHCSISSIYL